MSGTEINLLLKYCDQTNRGYISIDHFTNKLQELSSETKVDVMLRRFANQLKH